MSKHKNSMPRENVPPPLVSVVLPPIAGGEANLLPASALFDDLWVEFVPWVNSDPSTLHPEQVVLYWGEVIAGEKTWTAAIDSSDLFIMVPATFLSEGLHRLRYTVLTSNGELTPSDVLTLTIDKTPPFLDSADGGRLLFPPEVITSGITDHYLGENNDQVLAQVPHYLVNKPGDIITWYWSRSSTGSEIEAGQYTVVQGDSQPFFLTFSGQMIRDNGDGQRFASYKIQDRAGNVSPRALAAELRVDAAPVPRVLPWPVVEEAKGAGQNMTLIPEDAENGVIVAIPDDAVIYPGEQVWVQWADPNSGGGSYRTDKPIDSGGRRFAIPMQFVAAHIDKTVPVFYEVIEASRVWTSQLRQLRILKLDNSHLPTIQCIDAGGQSSLRLATLPAAGAGLRLDRWRMMTTDQCVCFKVTGVTTTGVATEYTALLSRKVTPSELQVGVGQAGEIKVPKVFLSTLMRNAKFSMKVYVSFEAGQLCPEPPVLPNFPSSDLTLVD